MTETPTITSVIGTQGDDTLLGGDGDDRFVFRSGNLDGTSLTFEARADGDGDARLADIADGFMFV